MQEIPSAINRYRSSRTKAFAAMADLRSRVDEWLGEHEDGPLNLTDLASLEALNGEREKIISVLQQAEAELMEALIHRMSGQGGSARRNAS
jgi:hypothetical protein